ncbi:MAG: uracil-DNA glycosylase, partial [Pseudomonadota bacterium]
MTVSPPPIDPHALLEWYAESGVTTAEGEAPSNLYDWPDQGFPAKRPISSERAAAISSSPAPVPRQPRLDQQMAPLSPDEAAALATQVAANANSIEELDHIIRDFEGCPLKPGAKNTVIYDGTPGADLLIIGEAPGRDEDRIGKPFVGRAGILLDKMLKAIHLSRQSTDDLGDVCITNAVYWRPPGNRNPTKAEISICLPFVRRFIDLS